MPIAIPSSTVATHTVSRGSTTLSSSPPITYGYHHVFTSSDSEDALSPQQDRPQASLPGKPSTSPQDPAKVILSGYLMKCGSKRRTWRKRWFVLSGEKLVYSGSHMVCFCSFAWSRCAQLSSSFSFFIVLIHTIFTGHQTSPSICI